MSSSDNKISRRTIARGAAWAAPAVAVVGVAPVAAASGVAPCIPSFTAVAGGWNVGGADWDTSPSCNQDGHCDARPVFNISPCDTPVTIRVSTLAGKSVWCWTSTGGWFGNSPAADVWSQTKTLTSTEGGQLAFAQTGDIVGNSNCQVVDPGEGAINDGIHVNKCQTNQLYVEIFYTATATGTPAHKGYITIASNCASATHNIA